MCAAFPQSHCSMSLCQVNRGSGEPWAAQQGGPVPGRVRHELSTRTNAQEHCRSESRRAAWAVAAAAVGGLLPPVSRQLQKRQSDRARRHCGLQGCAAVAAGRARTASGSRRLLGCAAFRAARTRACHCLRSASAAGAQHEYISRERDTDSEVDLGDDKVGGMQIQTVQIKDSKYDSLGQPSTFARYRSKE